LNHMVMGYAGVAVGLCCFSWPQHLDKAGHGAE
jgi:hypothetical protein